MIEWDSLLATSANSGVYRVQQRDIPHILHSAAKTNLSVFTLDFAGVNGKPGFLETAARAMQFPSYFGQNWDALEDCLTDLSWHHAEGYVVLMQNLRDFSCNAPIEMSTAREIFQDAATFWKNADVLFFVALVEE